jgi:hypothetical protein
MPEKKRKSPEPPSPQGGGGGQAPKDAQDLVGNGAVQESVTKHKRGSYELGEHGAKKREQTRLTEMFGNTVSGDTHESEHTIGFEPLNQTTGLKRGSKGRATSLENHAPAYQESKPMHRAHIGTGTTGEKDGSGFNSHTYRESQRSLLEQGEVGDAVQLNQLGYAFLEDEGHERMFQKETGWQKDAADESFQTMVKNMGEVTYGQGEEDVSVGVSPIQKVEMMASRDMARTGDWTDRDKLREYWAKLGFHDPYESDMDEDKKPTEEPKKVD